MVPGFIDLQVNGGGGVLFNDEPSLSGLEAITRAHRALGTTGLMVTLISDSAEIMRRSVRAVREALARRLPGLIGIHLEGPWLAAPRRGVHDSSFFRDLSDEDIDLITSLRPSPVMITVAPEVVSCKAIARLADAGVRVCLGHSNADYQTAMRALEAGASGVTHLFNAMSPLTGREPGLVGAALSHSSSWCGIILDLHHVHPASAMLALRAKPPGKIFLVTDAMPTVGSQLNEMTLFGRRVLLRNGHLQTDDGVLAGAHLDMATAVRNAKGVLGVDAGEALRMASLYPAAFLGLDHERGRIAPGYRADMALLDQQFVPFRFWINGEEHA